jgi:hypothetical protein
MNIYQKIAEVMKDIQYLAKDDHVKFGSTDYKAVSEEKVTSTVRESLIKNGIVIIPVEQSHHREGTLSTVDVSYRIQNIEDPEDFIIAKSSGTGADTQDKGVGKAMTYAYKYLLLRTFAIPTGEDPDKVSSAELDAKAKKEADKKAKDEAKKPQYIDEIKQTVLLKELHRTGWDAKEMLAYLGKKFPKNPPTSLGHIDERQFTFIVKALEKRPTKSAEQV